MRRSLGHRQRHAQNGIGTKLVQRGVASENDLKMMDNEIKQTVIQAAAFATESPEPGVEELYTDIVI